MSPHCGVLGASQEQPGIHVEHRSQLPGLRRANRQLSSRRFPVGLHVDFGFRDLREIVGGLHSEPGLGGAAKCFRQAYGHFGRDAGLFVHQIVQRLAADSEHASAFGYGEPERFQAFVPNNPGRGGVGSSYA